MFELAWLSLDAGICRDPLLIPTSPRVGQTTLPTRSGLQPDTETGQRKWNRKKFLHGRARPCSSTTILHVTQGRGKKAQDLAKPTKPQNWSVLARRCSRVSAGDLRAKKMPFPAGKGSGLQPPDKLICVCAKPFHFHGKKMRCSVAYKPKPAKGSDPGAHIENSYYFEGISTPRAGGGELGS